MEIANPLSANFFDSLSFPFDCSCALRGKREISTMIALVFTSKIFFCQSAVARL